MTRLIYSRNWPRIAQLMVLVILAGYANCVFFTAKLLRSVEDPFLRYALAFVIVQCSILAVLGVFLIGGKHIRVQWEWRRASRIRKLEERLADPSADQAIVVTSQKWPDEFLTVTENALLSLKGSARERVVGLLEASGPYRKLLTQTGDRDPSRAIRAIGLLGQLDSPEARAAVQLGARHRSEVVRQAAHKAIMQGSDQEAQRVLLDGFTSMSPWQRLVLFHFAPADSTLLPGFVADALHSGNEARVLVALQVVLTQQRLLLSPAPEALALSQNPEIRIKFFKALPFLQVEGDLIQTLQGGLGDADWRVRAMAARACGHFRPAVLVDRLLAICRDFANPAEAAHAARALASLGGEAWLGLQEMAYHEPGLARHIATEAVERHILGGAA